MPKSRYQTMLYSETEKDPVGGYWPDPLTFPVEKFKKTSLAIEYNLSSVDIQRIDALVSGYYGTPEFDDLLLWLNDEPFIYDTEPGTVFQLPLKKDLESFYAKNTR